MQLSGFSQRNTLLFGAVLVALAVAAVFLFDTDTASKVSPNLANYDTKKVVVGEEKLVVFVADTDKKRERGLSGVPGLESGEGMLFVFDSPDRYGIWMKEMLIPIDVLWFDEGGKLVHMVENMRPESYPQAFTPPLPAKTILEVHAGFIGRSNSKIIGQTEIKILSE